MSNAEQTGFERFVCALEHGVRIVSGCAEHLATGLFDGLRRIIEHVMAFFSDVAVPAADALVAFIAAKAVMNLLGFPWWIAVVAGLAMEGVGQLVAETPFKQRFVNQTLEENEEPVPAWAGWTIFIFHTVFSVGFLVVNVVRPDLALFGIVAMAVLSLTGTIARVLRNDCNQILARREQRNNKETPIVQGETSAWNDAANETDAATKHEWTERQQRIADAMRENRFASYDELAKMTKLTKGVVYREVKEHMGVGSNGHGWEVA